MAFRYSPKIVTDGLILYYDAANPKSYVSGDTISNDLSITKSNGTLTNGVLYDIDSKGSWVFDGLNDIIDCTNNSAFDLDYGDSFSIETWVNFSDLTSFGFLVSKWLTTVVTPLDANAYFVGTNANKFTFRTFNSGGATQGIIVDSNISLSTGTWYHLVATYDGTDGFGVNLYVNNISNDSVLRSNPVGSILNSEPLQIGGQYLFFTNGKIANVKIYNKELTQEEVGQNYNTLKYRFGL